MYLLVCDYLSSPDIDASEKLELYSSIFKGNNSKSAMDDLSVEIGFADWDGVNIEHLLARKELRPAYD